MYISICIKMMLLYFQVNSVSNELIINDCL